MAHLIEFFNKGGPFMYGVAALFLLGLVVSLGLTVVACLRKRVPAAAWLALPALTVILGAVGRMVGNAEVVDVVPAAIPAGRDQLLFSGLSIATFVEELAWMLTGVLMFAVTLGVALGQAVGAGKGARWKFGRPSLAVVLGWLGAGGVVAAIWPVQYYTGPLVYGFPLVLLLGALPVAVVSLREGVEQADACRAVAARVMVGSGLVLGTIALVLAAHRSGEIQAVKGLGAASSPQQTALVASGLSISEYALSTGAVALIGAVVVLAVLGLAPLGQLVNLRSMLGAAVVIVLSALPIGAVLFADHQARDSAASSYLLRATEAARPYRGLPLSEETLDGRFVDDFTHLLALSGGSWHDVSSGVPEAPEFGIAAAAADIPAEPVDRLSLPPDSVAALLVSGSTPATELMSSLRPDPPAAGTVPRVKILTRSPRTSAMRDHPWTEAVRMGSQDYYWLPLPGETRSWPVILEGDFSPSRRGDEADSTVPIDDVLFIYGGAAPAEEEAPTASLPHAWLLATRSRGPVNHSLGPGFGADLLAYHGGSWRLVVLVPGAGWTTEDVVHLCHWATSPPPEDYDDYSIHLRQGWLPDAVCALGDGLPEDEATLDLLWRDLRPETKSSRRDRSRRDRGSSGEREDRGRSRVKANMGGVMEVTYGDAGDLSAVKKYVSKKKGQIKSCYEEQLKADPELAGKVEVVWTVMPSGTVSGVSVESNTTGNKDIENCIIRRIKRWQFAEQDDEFEITYPFTFFTR